LPTSIFTRIFMGPAMLTSICFLLLSFSALRLQAANSPPSTVASQEVSNPSRLSSTDIARIQSAAETGEVSAQTKLGKAYRDGNGVAQNDALAFKWIRKAAEQGDPTAENDLGVMYRTGTGVAPSKNEAVVWYAEAARQGNPEAMFNLGASYYNGDGVAIDDTSSYAWFLLAKETGNSAAEDALRRADSEKKASLSGALLKIAKMFEAGDELPKNADEALKWYRKAADIGDTEASVRIAEILLGHGRNPNSDDYAEVRRRCQKAAERYSPAAYCLALIYRRGLGVPQDQRETIKWLNRAAEMEYARATLDLSEAFAKGEGVKPDNVMAYMWVSIASDSKVPGSEQAEELLHHELSNSQMEKAKRKAADWLRKYYPLVLRRRIKAAN
jgi:uncharacterized protein